MEYLSEYNDWLKSPYMAESVRRELLSLPQREIARRFGSELSFGTAGLRGVAEAGLSGINVYTLTRAIRAFAEHIGGGDVIVCRDARRDSSILARAAACALAERGISVKFFKDPRPTPQLSFAVRHFGAAAGINITASHNPKEYNGCKFYDSTGGQMGKKDTDAVAALIPKYPVCGKMPESFEFFLEKGLISYADCDEPYISRILKSRLTSAYSEKLSLTAVYTAFCGVGGSILPEVFRRAGIENLVCEPVQIIPDGDFPTISDPNPENGSGLERAEALAASLRADLVIATDPDADRMTASVFSPEMGGFIRLTGNQIGTLFTHYIIKTLKRQGRLPENPFVIKTIVTTPLIDRICEKEGALAYSTFTGFKYMAEKLRTHNARDCVLCFEESIGYMTDMEIRDKDGISAALLLYDIAAECKSRGETLLDTLEGIYKEYGRFSEKTVNLYFKSPGGMEKMSGIMNRLREAPPKELCGFKVLGVSDYLTGENAPISGENVLEFALSCGRVLIRPSGTEPKIKIYAHAEDADCASLAEAVKKHIEQVIL